MASPGQGPRLRLSLLLAACGGAVVFMTWALVAAASLTSEQPPGPVLATEPPPDPKGSGDPFAPTPTVQGAVPATPACTITGPRGKPLRGTATRDVICGSSGPDLIYAGGGDIVKGGAGNDQIIAANGKSDWIIGGQGRDRGVLDRDIDDASGVERTNTRTVFALAVVTTEGETVVGSTAGGASGISAPSTAGADGRFPVLKKGWYRHKLIGKLTDADGRSCTATVVAINIVLTAAHCVYRERAFAPQPFTFTPDLWGRRAPFGTWTSRDVVILKDWSALADSNSGVAAALDYAFVVLQPNTEGRSVGDVLGGWFGITTEFQGLWYTSVGYASGSWFSHLGGNHPYFCLSKLAATAMRPDATRQPWYELGIGCPMTGSAGGGPWLVDLRKDRSWNFVASVGGRCQPRGCSLAEGANSGFARTIWGPYFTRSVLDLLAYAKTL